MAQHRREPSVGSSKFLGRDGLIVEAAIWGRMRRFLEAELNVALGRSRY